MKKLAFLDKKICVACGACMKVCPKAAISVYRGCYASVDEAKCVGCGLCAKTCPAGCIAIKERSEAK
ncbi:MAG: 4Fe-4S binding protein [Oscillospiraceae bacterium]|nr:4Fe-4S binding protein [Oscillospiraceae bacterium]